MPWILPPNGFRFGIVGKESLFNSGPIQFDWFDKPYGSDARNLDQTLYTHVIKVIPQIDIVYKLTDYDDYELLHRVQNNLGSSKQLLFDSPFYIREELRLSSSKRKVSLIASSRVGITIAGVWLESAPGGTNYWTGGTFDETKKEVSLGTDLPANNTDVTVDYSYQGWAVDIKDLKPSNTNEPYQITLSLEGV